MIRRCPWTGLHPLYQRYHDTEWGVPVHNERRLFELLLLEGAQAGLAWITVLRKREGYREAFDQVLVAGYDRRRIGMLVRNQNIIRNRTKIESAVSNCSGVLASPSRVHHVRCLHLAVRWGTPQTEPMAEA